MLKLHSVIPAGGTPAARNAGWKPGWKPALHNTPVDILQECDYSYVEDLQEQKYDNRK